MTAFFFIAKTLFDEASGHSAANINQLAQNRHPSLNNQRVGRKVGNYIFGKVAREEGFFNTNLSCRRESRELVGVNCDGWHYIIKSVLRAT